MDDDAKFYQLVHPGGPRGIIHKKPVRQAQDKEARSVDGYAVVFFPRITGLGAASLDWPRVSETISQTPEAAIAKFLDGMAKGQTWDTYHDAGHRVRRVRIIDLGDAESGNLQGPDNGPDNGRQSPA